MDPLSSFHPRISSPFYFADYWRAVADYGVLVQQTQFDAHARESATARRKSAGPANRAGMAHQLADVCRRRAGFPSSFAEELDP